MSSVQILLRQRTALAKFGELALKGNDLDEILHQACCLVSEALDTPLAKVMELQPDGKNLLVRSGVGWKPGVVGHELVPAKKHSSEGFALQTGEPIISKDINAEDLFDYPQFLKEHGVRALVNVIILGPDGQPPFGLLEVDSTVKREFSPDDIDFLRTYANLLGATVDRLSKVQTLERSEAELREREAQYRAATVLNPQIPWTADAQGLVDSFDDRWLALTGRSREALLGEGWVQVPHPDHRERMQQAWQHSLASGAAYDTRARLQTASGDYGWYRVRAFAQTDEHGQRQRWYGTVEDIQERMDLESALLHWNETLEERVRDRTSALEQEQAERAVTEEKLRQSQKMEAVGQLTGGIAHDFNNMLAGVISSLELLQLRIARGRLDDLDRYIILALTSANRAAGLTQRLLAFSRQQRLEPKDLQASLLVSELEDLIRRTVGPGIRFEILIGDTGFIHCDPNQLENALLNLAINARDAMPNGGVLTLETKRVSIEPHYGESRDLPIGDYLKISLTDTGAGMSPETLARVFEPFFTTKPLGEGTGLGLSMVFGFMEQSGGQIRVHSQMGEGTSVSLFFPRGRNGTERFDTSAKADPDACPTGDGERILVVDDEPVVRKTMAAALREFGYQVTEAADGASALAKFKQAPDIQVLVTDIGLAGGMSGKALYSQLVALRPELRVLFVSGFAGPLFEEGLPGQAFQLAKPFTMTEFSQCVSQLVRSMYNPR